MELQHWTFLDNPDYQIQKNLNSVWINDALEKNQ